MLDGTEVHAKFEGKLTYAFKNDSKNLGHRLKNSHFTLESKMAEQNHKKISKQLHPPDTV